MKRKVIKIVLKEEASEFAQQGIADEIIDYFQVGTDNCIIDFVEYGEEELNE